jgi:zinc protease
MIHALENPSFDQGEILRERARLLSDQQAALAHPARRALALLWQARAPGHAYGRTDLGLPEAVAKLTDEKVRAWYAATIETQYPVVGIVGDTDGSSLVSRHVAEGFERSEVVETLEVAMLPPAEKIGDAVERRDLPATAQTIGAPAPVAGPADTFGGAFGEAFDVAAVCATEHLARRLTTKHAVPALVTIFADRRRLEGAAVVLVVAPARAEDVVRDAVMAEFAAVAGAPVEALETGRALAATSYGFRLQDHAARLLEYVRAVYSGTGISLVESYPKRLAAVPAEAVRKAAALVAPARSWRGVVRGRP